MLIPPSELRTKPKQSHKCCDVFNTDHIIIYIYIYLFFRNSARHRQTGAVTVGNPYESATKQTPPLPVQARRTNGDGVVPNLVLLTTKGSQKAGFQQEEKQSVHQIPSRKSKRANEVTHAALRHSSLAQAHALQLQ